MHSFDYMFWSRVNKSEGCWTWNGSIHKQGYGLIKIGQKVKRAHRIAYELENGAIPAGLLVDHICHNTSCVKPAHLRLATTKQNMENLGKVHSHNSNSGVRGVYRTRQGKWQARVTHKGSIYTAGTHSTIAEAEAAVIALRNELFTHNDADRAHPAA